jgi:hypothetical protein
MYNKTGSQMSYTDIMSVSDVFAALGGNSSVARLLGVGASTTSEMKRRGRIPAEYWRDLIAAAQRQGRPEITLEVLAKLHARKPTASTGGGFSESAETVDLRPTDDGSPSAAEPPLTTTGQFSRWKHLRRPHFASSEEINAHISALRDEWDRR